MTRRPFVLVTCEHGGNRIPACYRTLFVGARVLLATHRGYDGGALGMAGALARGLDAPLVTSTVSRLLVDLNRSIGHRALYSDATRGLARAEHERILTLHYLPYRQQVETRVARAVAAGRRVVHISSHSFTPILGGVIRDADVGLLYDPARPGERALAGDWRELLARRIAPLRVRRNYPYQGRNDGLTSHLRKRFAPTRYVGIELEINQKHVDARNRVAAALRRAVIASLREALALAHDRRAPTIAARVAS
ncbi:MAG: N-formylglutamate amidohydrolase [Casimicrobiaceae bacterium]